MQFDLSRASRAYSTPGGMAIIYVKKHPANPNEAILFVDGTYYGLTEFSRHESRQGDGAASIAFSNPHNATYGVWLEKDGVIWFGVERFERFEPSGSVEVLEASRRRFVSLFVTAKRQLLMLATEKRASVSGGKIEVFLGEPDDTLLRRVDVRSTRLPPWKLDLGFYLDIDAVGSVFLKHHGPLDSCYSYRGPFENKREVRLVRRLEPETYVLDEAKDGSSVTVARH